MMSKFLKTTTLSLGFLIACLLPGFALTSQAGGISGGNIVDLTNQERSAAGLNELSWNGSLSSSAYAKAQDMCTKRYWAHDAPDGTTPWDFILGAGYDYIDAGENLASDYSTDAGVLKGWMNSPAHRANILNGAFQEIGVATVTCTLVDEETTLVVAHYGSQATEPSPEPAEAPQPKSDVEVEPEADETPPLASQESSEPEAAPTSDATDEPETQPASPATAVEVKDESGDSTVNIITVVVSLLSSIPVAFVHRLF